MICEGYGEKKDICKNQRVSKKSGYCRNCAGRSFEDMVARLFAIQGYNVRQNLKLSSTQIDMFAELCYGFGNIGIIVECKYKFDSKDSVNGEDIRKFSSTRDMFNKRSIYGRATQAFFVTNGSICPEAREVANECQVEVYTYNDLVRRLVNFEPYLKSIMQKFEDSHLNGHFISLETKDGFTIMEDIKDFLTASDERGLVILGDYGSGKSSLALKLCYDFSKRILSSKDSPIPLLIELRDYAKALNMEQLITNLFINKYNILNGTFNTFMELLKMGKLLLVFDGFDEISRKVDYSVKYQVFNEICRFAIGNSKIIITCRGNFFNQKGEFEEIFKTSHLHFEPTTKTIYFKELEIAELREEQIERYIKSYENKLRQSNFSISRFQSVISNTHDLLDLAKRPVLLNVIINTIPKLELDKIQKVNAAKLYKEYTKFWLDREDLKGKTLIRSKDKLLFTQKLALDMFNKNQLSIHFSDIPEEVKKYFNIIDFENIDFFSHDIKSCSFLTRDDSGEYSFIHKSFMEYFTAVELLSKLMECNRFRGEDLRKQINTVLGENLITLEVGLFVYDLIDLDEFKDKEIQALFNKVEVNRLNTVAYKNAIAILSKTGTNIYPYIKKGDLSNTDLSHAVIKDVNLLNVNFRGSNFYESEIINSNFENSDFTNCNFKKCKITNSKLARSFFEYSDLRYLKAENCDFSLSILAESNMSDCTFKGCDFTYADFSGFKYNDNTEFDGECDLYSAMGYL